MLIPRTPNDVCLMGDDKLSNNDEELYVIKLVVA